jgi:WD40 repeat protein
MTQLLVMDAETALWSVQRAIETHPAGFRPTSVHFDSDGSRIATSHHDYDDDSTWKVWDVAAGMAADGLASSLDL